ncbi:unnamed protein product [Triticum turgidum subsp. durum]|uniref:Uncharacterized protein n=1 Tax=Triticum turgidum subsp. durum TaxID=4567 RepID=A0A9R0SUH8_TRITD|nr:unnamed protein product [Triticum turgidum subsp. durum]
MYLPLLANAPGAGDGRSFQQVRETQLHTQPIPPNSPHLCCASSVELRPWHAIPIAVVTPMARAGSAIPTVGPLLDGRPSLMAANNSGRCRVCTECHAISDVAEHSHTARALGLRPLFGAPSGSTCAVGGSGATAPRGVIVGRSTRASTPWTTREQDPQSDRPRRVPVRGTRPRCGQPQRTPSSLQGVPQRRRRGRARPGRSGLGSPRSLAAPPLSRRATMFCL